MMDTLLIHFFGRDREVLHSGAVHYLPPQNPYSVFDVSLRPTPTFLP